MDLSSKISVISVRCMKQCCPELKSMPSSLFFPFFPSSPVISQALKKHNTSNTGNINIYTLSWRCFFLLLSYSIDFPKYWIATSSDPSDPSSHHHPMWQVQAKLLDDGSQGSPPSALLRLLPSEAERLVTDFDGQVLQGGWGRKETWHRQNGPVAI